eukprot:COSAG01_NODE_2381_length_7792_cov_5.907578_3_plen_63_part_00
MHTDGHRCDQTVDEAIEQLEGRMQEISAGGLSCFQPLLETLGHTGLSGLRAGFENLPATVGT